MFLHVALFTVWQAAKTSIHPSRERQVSCSLEPVVFFVNIQLITKYCYVSSWCNKIYFVLPKTQICHQETLNSLNFTNEFIDIEFSKHIVKRGPLVRLCSNHWGDWGPLYFMCFSFSTYFPEYFRDLLKNLYSTTTETLEWWEYSFFISVYLDSILFKIHYDYTDKTKK